MDLITWCLIGALTLALLVIISGAFFSGERIAEERFEGKLAEEENAKNKKILEANLAARDLSDDDIGKRLSKLASRGNIIVYPGRGKDQP